MYGLNDPFLEGIRAVILVVLIGYLVVRGRRSQFSRLPGAWLITLGFCLLLLATLLDITDEFPGLERYVVIGATPAEAWLETIFGYLAGFVCIFVGVVKVIPALDKAEEVKGHLSESEEKFRSVFETIPEVVAITRLSDGLVVDLNPAFEELTSLSRDQLIGRSSLEVDLWVDPADRDRMMQGVRAHGLIRNFEARFNTSGGQVRDCLVSARLMHLQGEPHILAVFKDITERKAALRSLQESETRFRLVFESSPDPLVIARADGGGILEVNQAFAAETGISREEAVGKTSTELNLWADPVRREQFLMQLRRDGAVANFEARFRRKNGELRTGLASAQLLELSGSSCMLLDTRDITAQKQAEDLLMEMDRMKSDFISTAAHELRTPLATMLGYTELLRMPDEFGSFSVAQRAEFLEEINLKGETLSRIIDELLDISRIESGQKISLDQQPHEPRALLANVLRCFEVQSQKHRFHLESPGVQPSTVVCDLHRLTQVLENLLSNAVKYSPRGGTITVSGESSGAEYVISVADQGIGMTAEQQARVFDKFYRVDASNTAISGLGLGMSIARQIVEEHGGRIWVKSAIGAGTTVTFTLPLAT